MLYSQPDLTEDDLRVVDEIEAFRAEFRSRLAEPRRWQERLSRSLTAAAVRGSTHIEGYTITAEDAETLVAGGEISADTDEATRSAVTGYRDALTYIQRAAQFTAQEVQRRFEAAARLWHRMEELAHRHRLDERTISALYAAAQGHLRRTDYQHEENLPRDQALADLRALRRANLIESVGHARNQRYIGGPALREARAEVHHEVHKDLYREPYR
jgi:hypothetical protein